MRNLWPESFKELDIKSPKEILDEQVALLPTLTGDIVYGQVSP